MTLVARLPTALGGALTARRAAGIDTRWPVKGPTWQSVARGRTTEVEYLNGEIVRTGKAAHVATPFNAFVVTLMQRVTSTGHYLSPRDIELALRQAGLLNASSMPGSVRA
jgi:2-dehydropantoate 2-reductase